ncbi:MAG: helix-turn-helix transcriptional regulator [Caldilineaceae bacterium]
MIIHLKELQGRFADQGKPSSLKDISDATGIDRVTLENFSAGKLKRWRPEYLDALCSYFDCQIGDLATEEKLQLPLNLVLRPDRRGKRVGEFTKNKAD